MSLFGGEGKRERKAVQRYLDAPSIDSTQIEELKQLGPLVSKLLFDVLKETEDHEKRFRVLVALESLGISKEMFPTVLKALKDPDDFVQESAARIIRRYRESPETTIPDLIADYREGESSRFVLLQILAEYGAVAHAAVPVIRDGLFRPLEAMAVAHCLASIGDEDLDAIERAMVRVMTDRVAEVDVRSLGPRFVSALEQFLLSCVPWHTVDAIPAWRRALEVYAEVCTKVSPELQPVLTELANFSDWRLRGEVSAQFLEMSRAKQVAQKLVQACQGD